MSENLKTCVEPYLAAFEQTYAAENYQARTIIAYRCLARKFGAVLDEAATRSALCDHDDDHLKDLCAQTTSASATGRALELNRQHCLPGRVPADL